MPVRRHTWGPDGRCRRCGLIRRTCAPDERTAAGTRLFHAYRTDGGPWTGFAGPCAPPAQLALPLVPPPSPARLAAAAADERAAETAALARRHPGLPPAVFEDETVREALRVFRGATAIYVPAWATQGRS